ncbi:MAG: grasp-with-spasm system A modified peptide [Candidatus Aminicenantia bacterium]
MVKLGGLNSNLFENQRLNTHRLILKTSF